ncbi:hypothetical protein F3Y22_tig00116976pilonHSYRG00110 [Hibiscus syriacus]|uniref:Uncharacterized protein n=1 Tax=Hibiscus syriacus TaxID=106335 RepID=A0A6A2WH42_HIBSY|nr:hypothetical protein F3Y22_tig00116976pilonHSYRG00110 [Hibiscus syriacus]
METTPSMPDQRAEETTPNTQEHELYGPWIIATNRRGRTNKKTTSGMENDNSKVQNNTRGQPKGSRYSALEVEETDNGNEENQKYTQATGLPLMNTKQDHPQFEEMLKANWKGNNWVTDNVQTFKTAVEKWNIEVFGHIGGILVCTYIRHIFESGTIPTDLNKTLLVFTAKNFVTRNDKPIPPNQPMVSENQTSFVPERAITDNIVITQNVIHSMKQKTGKKGWMSQLRSYGMGQLLSLSNLPEESTVYICALHGEISQTIQLKLNQSLWKPFRSNNQSPGHKVSLAKTTIYYSKNVPSNTRLQLNVALGFSEVTDLASKGMFLQQKQQRTKGVYRSDEINHLQDGTKLTQTLAEIGETPDAEASLETIRLGFLTLAPPPPLQLPETIADGQLPDARTHFSHDVAASLKTPEALLLQHPPPTSQALGFGNLRPPETAAIVAGNGDRFSSPVKENERFSLFKERSKTRQMKQ